AMGPVTLPCCASRLAAPAAKAIKILGVDISYLGGPTLPVPVEIVVGATGGVLGVPLPPDRTATTAPVAAAAPTAAIKAMSLPETAAPAAAPPAMAAFVCVIVVLAVCPLWLALTRICIWPLTPLGRSPRATAWP